VFNLIELLANITSETFDKRKTILGYVINSAASCDCCFPEEILFRSFDYFNDYEFTEERSVDLFWIIDDVLKCDSFPAFQVRTALVKKEYDFYHFLAVDTFMTKNFYEATVKGMSIVKDEFRKANGKIAVDLAGKQFDIGSRRKLLEFLNEPLIDASFNILALATEAQRLFACKPGQATERAIYESYNGQLHIFVNGFSEYSKRLILNDALPSRNDFQDLTHLYYLRNAMTIKLVSSDKLFKKNVPKHVISLETLLQGAATSNN